MMKEIALALVFLILLSGCIQQPPNPSAAEEIDAVKSVQLPAGWVLSSVAQGNGLQKFQKDQNLVAVIEFSNKDILCKVTAMGGVFDYEDSPSVVVYFYNKGHFNFPVQSSPSREASAHFLPTIETKNYDVGVYYGVDTICDDNAGKLEMRQRILSALKPFEAG